MRKAQRRAGAGSDPDPLPAAVTTSLELPRGIFGVWAARTLRASPEEFGRRKKHLAEKARDVCDWQRGGYSAGARCQDKNTQPVTASGGN